MQNGQRTYKDVKYRRLQGERIQDESDHFIGAQFEDTPTKIPWRAVSLAFFLCVIGSLLLVLGTLLLSGHIDVKYADRTWPLMILGFLMFLPGAYHVRIAYYAFKQYPGYSFDDIPEFE